jgi:uncharacterized phage protein (TIGR01671 family)
MNKYRFWHIEKNQMYDVGEIHFCHGGIKVCGQGILPDIWVYIEDSHKHKLNQQGILMQHTGVQDIRREDIYDGDIVEVALDEKYATFHGVGFVKFDIDHHMWSIYYFDNEERGFDSLTCNCKILGNIYADQEIINEYEVK